MRSPVSALCGCTRAEERVHDLAGAVSQELCGLQRTGNGLGHRACVELVLARGSDELPGAGSQRVEARVLAGLGAPLRFEGIDDFRCAAHGAAHVHAHHVGRAFPHAIQRCFTVQPSHRVFLDEAIAAVALQGLVGNGRCARAVEELGGRCCDAGQQPLMLAGLHAIGCLGDAQCEQCRGLHLHSHVGEHIAHHGAVGDRGAECRARGGVLKRERQRLAHQAGRADREVQAREMRVGQDLADATAFLAHADGKRARVLHLARRIRAIAGLVLEALHEEAVERAVGQGSRQEEACDVAVHLGKREEAVRLGNRAEPLVSGEFIPVCGCTVVTVGVREACGGLCLAQVRAALLFRHRIADHHRGLVAHFAAAEFILRSAGLLGPDRESRLGREASVGRVGHAGGAGRSLLDLVPEVGEHGACIVAVALAVARVGAPGEVGHLVLPGKRHQLVPAGMELDPVDAMAEAVVCLELGVVPVGQARKLLHVRVARHGAECVAACGGPGGLAADGGCQDRIAGEGIEAAGGLRLVAYFVCLVAVGRGREGIAGQRLVHGACLLGVVGEMAGVNGEGAGRWRRRGQQSGPQVRQFPVSARALPSAMCLPAAREDRSGLP